MTENSTSEDVITAAAERFAKEVSVLARDPYFREAVLKMAIREFVWALDQEFPNNRYEIADILGDMGMTMQDEARKQ